MTVPELLIFPYSKWLSCADYGFSLSFREYLAKMVSNKHTIKLVNDCLIRIQHHGVTMIVRSLKIKED